MNLIKCIKIISSFIIIVFICFIYYKRNFIVPYVENIVNNHFSKGSIMHVNHKLLPNMSKTIFPLFKLVTNTSSYRLISAKSIPADTLLKYKTDRIGTYLDYKIVPIHFNDTVLVTRIYMLKPNLTMIKKTDLEEPLPSGYSFYDNSYYIIANDFLIN